MFRKNTVLISTTAIIPGYSIIEYKNIIFERVVAGVGFISEFFASFTDTFGGRSGRMEGQMDQLYQTLLDLVKEKASQMEANGVIGFSIDIDEISGKGMSMLIIQGLGTAVVAEPVDHKVNSLSIRKPEIDLWICSSCHNTYTADVKYCTACGEVRHYPWTCSNCQAHNTATSLFCSNCGKKRDAVEENAPVSVDTIREIDMDHVDEDISLLRSSKEIYQYFLDRYKNSSDVNMIKLLNILLEKATTERLYGNSKQSSVLLVQNFMKHGMRFHIIDRNLPVAECPECGHPQNTDRSICMKCGALFDKSCDVVANQK